MYKNRKNKKLRLIYERPSLNSVITRLCDSCSAFSRNAGLFVGLSVWLAPIKFIRVNSACLLYKNVCHHPHIADVIFTTSSVNKQTKEQQVKFCLVHFLFSLVLFIIQSKVQKVMNWQFNFIWLFSIYHTFQIVGKRGVWSFWKS